MWVFLLMSSAPWLLRENLSIKMMNRIDANEQPEQSINPTLKVFN